MEKFLISFNPIFVQWQGDTFPEDLHGNEVLRGFLPPPRLFFLFIYSNRDQHQDEISESCPVTMTILIDLRSEALFWHVAHMLWGQSTPILVSSRPNHKFSWFCVPSWAQNTLSKAKSFITQICDPEPRVECWIYQHVSLALESNNSFCGFKETL